MKKIATILASLLAVFVMGSCSKDDIENTATVDLAGDWYVTVDAVDDNNSVVAEDFFSLGRIHMLTYNTAANVGTQLFVEDEGNFWNFKALTASDVNALTFATNGAVANQSYNDDGTLYEMNVTVSDGKVVKGGGVQKNGSVTDSISFYVSFSDDPYPAAYGYAKYHVHGVRYSGLTEND